MTLKPPAISWVSIKEAFETLEIGTMCRILVANPLVAGMPHLVFFLLATYNKFTAAVVEDQWAHIHKYHRAILEPRIGPLVGHGLDGDKRRKKLMLDSTNKGSYGLDLDTFLMKAEMQGNILMIMM
jgi:hypothetical protein